MSSVQTHGRINAQKLSAQEIDFLVKCDFARSMLHVLENKNVKTCFSLQDGLCCNWLLFWGTTEEREDDIIENLFPDHAALPFNLDYDEYCFERDTGALYQNHKRINWLKIYAATV